MIQVICPAKLRREHAEVEDQQLAELAERLTWKLRRDYGLDAPAE
jgi:hypothetical protein